MGRLQGKVAIVTGAARGMGEATVRAFVDEGARVLVADVLEAEGRALASAIGESAHFCRLDVSVEEDWIAAIATAEAALGPVDVLVNNAAINDFKPLVSYPLADFRRVLDVNLVGTFLGLRHVGEAMVRRRRGAIVNIASVDGTRGANGYAAYVSSKWGVRGLTRAAAMEYGPRGVRVNAVLPGGVYTTMGNPRGLPVEQINLGYGSIPAQRVGMPAEIAQASVFLASDQASYVCGAELVVDGGWIAGIYHPHFHGAPGDAAYGEPG